MSVKRPGRLSIRLVVAGALVILAALAGAQPASTPSLEEQLERARELDGTAPWRETRSVLDAIAPRLDDATPEQRADYWLIRARNHTLAGDMESALNQLEDLFDMPLTPQQEIRAYSLAANIALLLRRWEATFDYLNRALELAGKGDAEGPTHRPFGLAAYVYAKIGETGQATEYGQRAVEIALERGDARDVCFSQGRLAFAYKTAGTFEQARGHYRQALDNCRETGDELVTGTIESGLADLLRATGDHEQAEDLFETALPRLKATDYTVGLAEARFYKARLHWERDEFEQTERLLRQALTPLEDDQAWDYVAEAYGMLSNIESQRDNHEQALAYMSRQLDARERFLDLERARQLAHLQVAFDTRSREQELALLREQRRVGELEDESRRQRERLRWLFYGLGGFLFVVLVLLLAHVLRERRHFRRLARLDSLTGLSNHTRFFDTTRTMIEEAHQTAQPLVIALGDIDYFKRVNDEFGHIAGDHALQRVAEVLRESFPFLGAIGRIGGEEFAICLPGETTRGILRRLDSVRRALAGVDYGGSGKPLTMSFGVAELQAGDDLETLRKRADDALYRAKRAGRDTVVVAEQSSGQEPGALIPDP